MIHILISIKENEWIDDNRISESAIHCSPEVNPRKEKDVPTCRVGNM